jgi:hypothetical protein
LCLARNTFPGAYLKVRETPLRWISVASANDDFSPLGWPQHSSLLPTSTSVEHPGAGFLTVGTTSDSRSGTGQSKWFVSRSNLNEHTGVEIQTDSPNTKEYFHEKRNADQRIANGRDPDRDT